MTTFFGLMSIVAVCGTILALAMLILVSLPQSPLRAMLVQICGWAFSAFCLFYCISPIDILPEAILGPFGLIDDVGALIAGIASARAAWQAGKAKAALSAHDKERSAA